MKKYICFSMLLLSLVSCKKYDKNGREIKDYDELTKASWLLGTWQTETPNGNLQEIWTIKNDSTYFGQSYFIAKKDTIHSETIELVQDQEQLNYIATVRGENQDLPITFKFRETEDNELVFENPKHDYPSKIFYKQKDSLNLEVAISGIQLVKKTSERFKMKKLK